jgi:hypothetical protein
MFLGSGRKGEGSEPGSPAMSSHIGSSIVTASKTSARASAVLSSDVTAQQAEKATED